MGKFIDLTNERFGRLRVLRTLPERTANGNVRWECQCDCGKVVPVPGTSLRNGHTQSCGCFKRDDTINRQTTHGQSKSSEYRIFIKMKGRCGNPDYHEYAGYGARGIECRFATFEEFYAYLGPRPSPRHSVDRINNDGHYEPGNVRWATPAVQNRNKRTNRLLTHDNTTQTVTDWASDMGMPFNTLTKRLDTGWSPEEALLTPVQSRRDAPITYNGLTLTVRQWEIHLGMKRATLHARLYQMGWSVERALSTPVRKCTRHTQK